MNRTQFEKYLSRRIWRRRLVYIVIALILFAIGILFAPLQESSKEAVQIDIGGSHTYTSYQYTKSYLPLINIGMTGGAFATFLALFDLLFCRFRTFCRGDQYVSLYRGPFINIVYVNGAERGRCLATRHHNMVEVWLNGRVRASVYFTRSPINVAYISFSDDTATMEV